MDTDRRIFAKKGEQSRPSRVKTHDLEKKTRSRKGEGKKVLRERLILTVSQMKKGPRQGGSRKRAHQSLQSTVNGRDTAESRFNAKSGLNTKRVTDGEKVRAEGWEETRFLKSEDRKRSKY